MQPTPARRQPAPAPASCLPPTWRPTRRSVAPRAAQPMLAVPGAKRKEKTSSVLGFVQSCCNSCGELARGAPPGSVLGRVYGSSKPSQPGLAGQICPSLASAALACPCPSLRDMSLNAYSLWQPHNSPASEVVKCRTMSGCCAGTSLVACPGTSLPGN